MGNRRTPLSEDKKEFIWNFVMIALTVLQPLIWFMFYEWMGGPKYSSTYGLDIACFVCCIGSIIGLLWFRNWIINESNFFD